MYARSSKERTGIIVCDHANVSQFEVATFNPLIRSLSPVGALAGLGS